MVYEQTDTVSDAAPIPEIEALLSMCETASIVDGLLAIPRVHDFNAPNEWERAVTSRLLERIAKQMRAEIEGKSCHAA